MQPLQEKISIIIGFRNRETERARRCFDSLANQGFKDFELILVDYGSDEPVAREIADLSATYPFIRYVYNETRGWCWNRSHALNTGIAQARYNRLLLADIDLIFAPEFLSKLANLTYHNNFYTFDCYYLEHSDAALSKPWLLQKDWVLNYVGLCAVDKQMIEKAGWYNEYYLVWGVEDFDIYENLSLRTSLTKQHVGTPVFRVYHQWHLTHYDPKPTFWYMSMVDALYMQKLPKQGQPGRLFEATNRSCLQSGLAGNIDGMKELTLYYMGLLLFDAFYRDFNALKAGEYSFVRFTEEAAIKGRLHTVVSSANKLLGKLPRFNYQLTGRNKARSIINLRDVKDFVTYFIGMYRHLFLDYFFKIEGDSLLLILQKK